MKTSKAQKHKLLLHIIGVAVLLAILMAFVPQNTPVWACVLAILKGIGIVLGAFVILAFALAVNLVILHR